MLPDVLLEPLVSFHSKPCSLGNAMNRAIGGQCSILSNQEMQETRNFSLTCSQTALS